MQCAWEQEGDHMTMCNAEQLGNSIATSPGDPDCVDFTLHYYVDGQSPCKDGVDC